MLYVSHWPLLEGKRLNTHPTDNSLSVKTYFPADMSFLHIPDFFLHHFYLPFNTCMLVRTHFHNGVLGHQQLKRNCNITFTYKGHNIFTDFRETSSLRLPNVQNRHRFLWTVLLETEDTGASSCPSVSQLCQVNPVV